jgi:hypothetical protein
MTVLETTPIARVGTFGGACRASVHRAVAAQAVAPSSPPAAGHTGDRATPFPTPPEARTTVAECRSARLPFGDKKASRGSGQLDLAAMRYPSLRLPRPGVEPANVGVPSSSCNPLHPRRRPLACKRLNFTFFPSLVR